MEPRVCVKPLIRAGLAMLALAGCASGPEPTPGLPTHPVGLRYIGYDGEIHSLARLRGTPVLVEIVATWAGPALVEIERVRTLTEGRKIQVLVLVLDEEPEMAAIFARAFGLAEVVGRVPEPEALLGPSGPFGPIGVVPTGVLLDAEGRIALRSDGPWPEGTLERALADL